MIQQGLIEIIIDNISVQETQRMKDFIHTLIANGSLNLRNGCVKIYIDNTGTIQKIEHDFIKYSKKHSQT